MESDTIRALPDLKPKSDQCIIEALRGFIELAHSDRITFLDLTATVDGQTRAFSITTSP